MNFSIRDNTHEKTSILTTSLLDDKLRSEVSQVHDYKRYIGFNVDYLSYYQILLMTNHPRIKYRYVLWVRQQTNKVKFRNSETCHFFTVVPR